jgi:hypothetical protein
VCLARPTETKEWTQKPYVQRAFEQGLREWGLEQHTLKLDDANDKPFPLRVAVEEPDLDWVAITADEKPDGLLLSGELYKEQSTVSEGYAARDTAPRRHQNQSQGGLPIFSHSIRS